MTGNERSKILEFPLSNKTNITHKKLGAQESCPASPLLPASPCPRGGELPVAKMSFNGCESAFPLTHLERELSKWL